MRPNPLNWLKSSYTLTRLDGIFFLIYKDYTAKGVSLEDVVQEALDATD